MSLLQSNETAALLMTKAVVVQDGLEGVGYF
jgi:hypothetical protein